jgi:hypothetical protein
MADLSTLLAKFLEDLYAGTVTVSGAVTVGDGTLAAPSVRFASEATGLYLASSGVVGISLIGNAGHRFSSSTHALDSDTATLLFGASSDIALARTAANRLRLATGDVLNFAPTAFGSLPTGAEGDVAAITDSSTATPGATIAGGGANNVLGFFNGANWICL